MKTAKLVECPTCTGTGESPGAPERAGETALCWDCEGKKTLPRRKAILLLARQCYEDEGTIEIDDDAKLSEVEDGDNGAYVQAWVWVSFADRPGLSRED